MGFSPCASWNFLVASTVEASHFPFGFPVNEPFLASACWISEIRSGVGVFCPRSRRFEFFDDFDRCAVLGDLEGVDFFCAEATHTPNPAATSSVRVSWVTLRTRICVSVLPVATFLLLAVGRNFARQIECQDPVAVLPAKNLKYNVLAMLQF